MVVGPSDVARLVMTVIVNTIKRHPGGPRAETSQSLGVVNKMPFNSVLFKEILKQNKKFDEGVLKIYPKGLMAFVFKFGNLETNYYLVRNQN
jgi:hypothetical protein